MLRYYKELAAKLTEADKFYDLSSAGGDLRKPVV